MRRFCSSVLLVFGPLLGGCRIEQTPQRYIDHLETPAAEIEASREELQDRLLSVSPALERGSVGEINSALMPAPTVHVFGPEHGEDLRSADEIAAGLQRLREEGRWQAEHLVVDVGPRNNVAWFRATYTAGTDATDRFRFSGVFLRQEGEWRLIQGHLSRTVSSDLPPEAAADTAGGAG